LEVVGVDRHGTRPLRDPFLRPMITDALGRLGQAQSGDDVRMRPQVIQQPDQLQLRIRLRIDPKLDGIEALAELAQGDVVDLGLHFHSARRR
jgi:hypothetical protein